MTKIINQVRDLDESYILNQCDLDVRSVYEYLGIKQDDQSYTYLFVKLDKSGADYAKVYGCNSCNLDAYLERLK